MKRQPMQLSHALEHNIRSIKVFLWQLNSKLNKTLDGNKTQAQKARVLSLNVERLLLEFRKLSAAEMNMKHGHYPKNGG